MLAWFKRGNICIRNVNGLFLLVLGAEKPVLHKYWCNAWRWCLTAKQWLQNQ